MGAALFAAAYALVESRAPPSILLVLVALQRHAPFITVEDLQVSVAHRPPLPRSPRGRHSPMLCISHPWRLFRGAGCGQRTA